MVLHVLRGLFILIMVAVGWSYLSLDWLAVAICSMIGVFFVAIDILSPRRKLAVFSGVLFGLMVGILIAYGLSFAVPLIVDHAATIMHHEPGGVEKRNIEQFIQL